MTPIGNEQIRKTYGGGLDPSEAEQLREWADSIDDITSMPTAAELELFAAKRAENNLALIRKTVTSYPQTSFTHTEKRTWRPGVPYTNQKTKITDIQHGVLLPRHPLEDQRRIASRWATSLVWVDVDQSTIFDITEHDSNHAKTRIDGKKTPYPFTLIGVERDGSEEYDGILIAPLRFSADRARFSTIHTGMSYYAGSTTMTPRQTGVIEARLRSRQSSSLLGLMQVMKQEPRLLAVTDIDEAKVPVAKQRNDTVRRLLKDANHPTISLSESVVPLNGLQSYPANIDDLDEKDFDMTIVETHTDGVSDEIMKKYRVLEWLGRSSIVFDAEDAFSDALSNWKAVASQTNPLDDYLEGRKP